jgi:hypothetical protein
MLAMFKVLSFFNYHENILELQLIPHGINFFKTRLVPNLYAISCFRF